MEGVYCTVKKLNFLGAKRIHKAFTLAEVLITLAVIGIVAAITIPVLIQKHQEKVTVTKLKKAYNIINQAYQMAVIEHGTYDQWGMNGASLDEDGNYTDEFKNDFTLLWDTLSPYMKVVSRCTHDMPKCSELLLDSYKINTLDGSLRGEGTSGAEAALLLADGIMVTGGYTSSKDCTKQAGTSNMLKNVCADFSIKIGPKKPIYTTGKNSFYFYVTKYGIYPIGMPEDTQITFENHCSRSKKSSDLNGYGCTAWVIMNGNMDYLHCDDLSWDGKKTCSQKK